jgi:phenylacetate-CoA ligase
MLPSLRHRLHCRRYPARYAQLEILLRNQALSRDQLLRKQQVDFDGMVAFAAANVPYYAECMRDSVGSSPRRRPGPSAADLLDAGLRRDDGVENNGVSLDGLKSIPLLDKDTVRERLDDLLSRDAPRDQVKLGHTGGSTGKPLAFWYDDAKHELMRAGMMRGFMMSGWRPGQKVLNFWGARQDVAAGGVFGSGLGAGLGAIWSDWVAAEKTIAATEFSPAKLQEWASCIQAYKPVLLYGYASAMSELARFVISEKLKMPRSLIGIYATAEVLTDTQRDLMQQAFVCKVFNQYGCREVPNIAWECRHGNMHVFADLVLLESERIDGDDQLIVTSLTNRLMPFIRYKLGDSGRLLDGECACGSPFPLMEMGMCRQNDWIRGQAGQRIHPGVFNRMLDGQTRIRQYQWVQTRLDRIQLNLVSSETLSAETQSALTDKVRQAMDAEVVLEVHYLDEIPRTVSGKQRFVIGLG